jgi:hypothetical protein
MQWWLRSNKIHIKTFISLSNVETTAISPKKKRNENSKAANNFLRFFSISSVPESRCNTIESDLRCFSSLPAAKKIRN